MSDETKEIEAEYWKETLQESLGVEESAEGLQARFNSMRDEEKFALLVSMSSQLSIQSGVAMATMQDVFPDIGLEEYKESDYSSLCRTWDEEKHSLESIQSNVVLHIYSATRKAARNTSNTPSTSSSTTAVKNVSPVLITKGYTDVVAEEAHLCPSTGKRLKCDTWMYVAAAVLGMPFEEKEDRDCLIRAIRGSYPSSTNDEEERGQEDKKREKPTTIFLTGLNRCPFNLISFASQEHWFELNSGVMILPCLTMAEAKEWDGGPYSVLVLCSNGKTAKQNNVTAAHIAQQIQLQSVDLEEASTLDLTKAHDVLKCAIKASAFILKSKPGPAGAAQTLWENYQKSLTSFLAGWRASKNGPIDFDAAKDNVVPVPLTVTKPQERLASKINLAKCEGSGCRAGDTKAYPDPVLLAYKSSINWTREHEFQLMAEAEPIDQYMERDGLDTVFVAADDKSIVSALSAGSVSLPM